MIDIDLLRKTFSYDHQTGYLTRLTGQFAGTKQTCENEHGYVCTHFNKKSYKAHRIIWALIYGEYPSQSIDHINGVKNDNRIENLRLATQKDNLRNMNISATRKVNLPKGVSRSSSIKNPFNVYIYNDTKAIYCGNFSTIDEAAHAYNKAAVNLFGEFARLNPIGTDKAMLNASKE